MLVSLDGVLYGVAPDDYVAQVVGGGPTSTGWQLQQINFGTLPAGTHNLALGAYNNQKTYPDESAEVLVDDVLLIDATPVAPSITTPPANVTVTAPASASFSVVVAGTAPLSYQWRRNTVIIAGATSASYVLNPTVGTDNGAQFDVVVSNSAGSVTSTAATLTVNVTPSISTPPANVTVTAPAAANFSVVAGGTAPLSYQWRRNGAPIAGATSASYSLNPTAVSDSGSSFDVVVSNVAGSATSAAATLTVYSGEGIDAHFDSSADGFAYADDLFRATTKPAYASGALLASGGFTGGALQVLLGGLDGSNVSKMSGGWQRSFSLASATPLILSFRYQLIAGNIDSDEWGQMLVSVDGVLRGVSPNDYVVQVIGNSGIITTGWQQVQIDLGTLSAGTHVLALGDYLNKKGSSNETVEVRIDDVQLPAGTSAVAPSITTPPANVTVTAPTAASFSVVAAGTAPLSYQWRRGGAPIAGATAASYVLDPTAVTDSGASFDVVVSNSVGTVTSAAAILTVNGAPVPPSITTPPANLTVTAPASASFSVVATGTAPLSYQWRRDGAPIGGANSASYVLNPTAVTDSGASFDVVVSNSVGNVTSAAAILTVNAAPVPPSITTPPANATVTAPAPASFSVVAAGTAPLSYQWRRNGAPIGGATASSYVLDPTSVGDSGATFDVIVSNVAGSATSPTATLTVNSGGGGSSLIDAHFDAGTDGFAYADDLFRATTKPDYESGTQIASGGFAGGALRVLVGGINGSNISKMSGGWQRSFSLASATPLTLTFRYKLTTVNIDADEWGQVLASLDGVLRGVSPNDYILQVVGNGSTQTTGWQQIQISLGTLPAGTHVLALGEYLNKKGNSDETVEVVIDDVMVTP